MASSGKKGGGDFVLESRHLVGLFLMLVVIFGIVFTLGYLLGRTQYDTRLRTAISKPVEDSAPPPVRVAAAKKEIDVPDVQQPETPKSDPTWDYYHATDAKPPEERLQPATAKPAAEAEQPRPVKAILPNPKSSSKLAPASKTVPVAKTGIMLQIAAVTTETDALSLAQALQQKKIAAFVVRPGVDKYYRVQVGPYPNAKAAVAARKDLESKGFKPIIKH